MSEPTAFKQEMTNLMRTAIKETTNPSEIIEVFKQKNYYNKEFCKNGSKELCMQRKREKGQPLSCPDVHFKKIINPHTDDSLGNCSYLDTCRHMEYCKYIHYKIDDEEEKGTRLQDRLADEVKRRPKQWINCDLRDFDFTVLGECNVIMLDPPWDIHMNVDHYY